MKEEVEQLLPHIKMGKISETAIRDITNRIRNIIRDDPSKGRELGELIGRIRQAVKAKEQHKLIHWVQVQNGFLSIGHKPGGKISFEGLKDEGTDVVLTLLHDDEGASSIGSQAGKVNINWIWFPFSASNPHSGKDFDDVYEIFKQLGNLLSVGNKIYIHCSAGIHRTGMITYGLLRFLGMEKSEAAKTLQSLRKVTAEQVGGDRLIWGDQFAPGDHL